VSKLGAMYDLSPEAVAQLAAIQGTKPDPLATPALDAVKGYVPGASAEAAATGNPIIAQAKDLAGTPVWKRAEEMGRSIASSGALGGVPALLVKPPAPEAAKPGAAAGDTSLQGPATDNFPTVKTDYGDAVANGQAVPMSAGVRPAHWSPSTEKVSREGYELDPTALESMGVARDAAAGHGLLAADNRHQAATIEAEADAEAAKAKLVANQMGRQRLAELQAEKEAYESREMRNLQSLATQARAKVNPDAIWEGERGGLAKVMTALAIGMGQFGAMMRGGPNTAWQIVQHQIDTNIDAQKQKIANAKDAFTLQSNLYARNLQAFGDKERAVLATRMNYLDQVQNMLDMKRAEAKGNIADANYHDLQQKVLNERAGAEKEFLDLTKVKASEELTNKYHEAQAVGVGGQKGKDPLYVPTLGGYARDAETAQKLNNKGALRMQMTQNMKEIHGLMEKAKGLNSVQNFRELQDIEERIQGLVNDTLTKNTVIEGQGAMSKDDKEVAAAAKSLADLKVRGTLNSNIDRQQKRVWDASVRVMEHHRLDGEANGIQVGTEQYRMGPNGPEPVRVLAGRNKTVSKNTEAYDDLVSPPKGVPKK
jgi:hypothetical protein